MSYNVQTDKIHVFPLAKNRASDSAGRLFYEDNIANIIRQIVDTEGFIITKEPKLTFVQADNVDEICYDVKIDESTELQFNIYGYFVKLHAGAVISQLQIEHDTQTWELYATIEVDAATKEISGQDDGGVYTGVKFSTSKSASGHCLHLCTINTSVDEQSGNRVFDVIFDSNSFLKYDIPSIKFPIIRKIDGKH